MNWQIDLQTAQAAAAHPIPIHGVAPAAQFAGRNFDPQNWNHRIIPPANWPPGPITSSPQAIIQEFQNGQYLQGLALVVSWGKMWRVPDAIWGNRPLPAINGVLDNSAVNIQNTHSINGAWAMLTGNQNGQLGWSAVLTSKTLHFLCRALGFQQDPPVALDNAVIREKVWPVFEQAIQPGPCPMDWKGNTLNAYLRYMTAILTWAGQRYWSTTDMEATIFDQY